MDSLFAKFYTWPLALNMIRRGLLSNTFGLVRKNANGTPRPHQGWDFYAPNGTLCFAVGDGEVVSASNYGAYGLLLIIKLDNTDLYAAYGHMSEFHVRKGDKVTKGQQVGRTGCTGNAEGMKGLDQHLHFEIRTEQYPHLGLAGRTSPINFFPSCPLNASVICPSNDKQL